MVVSLLIFLATLFAFIRLNFTWLARVILFDMASNLNVLINNEISFLEDEIHRIELDKK